MGIRGWLNNRSVVQWIKTRLGLVSLPPLREFVYLDENAVISLLASTTGGITDQQSTRQRKQISGSIQGMVPDAKGKIGVSGEKSSEVVRRYVIQSNFTEFYNIRKDSLKLSDNSEIDHEGIITDEYDTPEIEDIELAKEDVTRGDLIELDVRLGSHDVFKIYKAVDLLGDIFESLPEQSLAEIDTDEFSLGDLDNLIELIDKFLTGLVPIVGEVQNYGIVEHNQNLYIAEKQVLDEEGIEYESVSVVGFVKEDELWQDSSRFLFDEKEYTVYCRVDNTRLKDDWVPLKLMDVVDSMSQGTTESVQNLSEAFDLGSETDPQPSGNVSRDLVRDDIELYFELIPLDVGDKLADDIIDSVLSHSEAILADAEEREFFLDEARRMIDESLSNEIEDITHVRIVGDVLSQNTDDFDSGYTNAESDWFMEVDFTSIYW